ncbi:TonB-dependent receptor [Alicycliphilus sp. B1]|nr:TonB-dependent receptor [Alicycliphilus sp. B1]
MFGVQTAQRRFSAVGEEPTCCPRSRASGASSWLEEYRIGNLRLEGALRHDRQTAELEDGTDRRRHGGTSASLGAVWRFAPGYAAGISLTRASRAPTAEELYARGLHMATSTYERGDAGLRAESSRNIDLSLRKTSGRHHLRRDRVPQPYPRLHLRPHARRARRPAAAAVRPGGRHLHRHRRAACASVSRPAWA